MLSQEYNRRFLQGLDEASVGILAGYGLEAYNTELSLFYPSIGKDFTQNRELLIIGQATNGWQPHFTIGNEVTHDIGKLVDDAIRYSKEEGDKCSLEWINEEWTNQDYSLYRSFFWNITYKLVKTFYGRNDKDWNNIIAWSNLMKIAPKEGGNPDATLIRAQRGMAAALFKKEIEDLRPKNVLLLTNLQKWAKPILDYNFLEYKTYESGFIEATANLNGSKIIVTKRGYVDVTHEQAIAEISKYMVK